MALILLTTLLIAIAMLAMAAGVLLGKSCLRGSCGGPEAVGPDGQPLSCAACPNRDSGLQSER